MLQLHRRLNWFSQFQPIFCAFDLEGVFERQSGFFAFGLSLRSLRLILEMSNLPMMWSVFESGLAVKLTILA